MTDKHEGHDNSNASELSPEELFDELEPFEPYTADELAETLDTKESIVKRVLNRLNRDAKVRKKKTKSGPAIWIRKPPVNSCGNCGREFEVKFLHPVLSSMQFCPRCGNQI